MRLVVLALVALFAVTACQARSLTLGANAPLQLARMIHPRTVSVFAAGYGDPISMVTSTKGLIFIADDVGGRNGPPGVYELAGGQVKLLATSADLRGSVPLALSFQYCATGSGTTECGLNVSTRKGELLSITPF